LGPVGYRTKMKQTALVLLLAAAASGPALAEQPGGIAGTVVDARTNQPVAHAQLYYYRAPYRENGPNRIMSVQSNSRGFFSDITLEPGRYVIMARFGNAVEGCALDDVISGEVARVRLEIGHNTLMCSGPRFHPAMVDPNASADVYRI